ncbi:hypothetical protein BuS5_00596 [Desulfosarcina sp. BuS5]|uniref:hypothetical protein n=1 Tax=Desulfosarcina sp. BuS5 TaxID=933262 RepID=UPI0004807959|nr:hypothetical protein [Desulfosarcina sp. BuS5]WDN87628.1 hypothetical protein BuS5_00596 [Desulfosarcina sp. BuS5]
MSILEKLKIIKHKNSGIIDFCIETIRFRKLLENASALLDFFEDGHGKILGEYILDRHYVTSLIENVLERLGMMIYDACVLAPESGEKLYTQYDKHKLKAWKLLRVDGYSEKKDFKNNEDSGSLTSMDPEYKLLAEVLKWLNGESSDPGSTVMDFMIQTYVCVLKCPEARDILKRESIFEGALSKEPGGNIYLVELWKDAVAPSNLRSPRSLDDINCIPLKYFLMDVHHGDSLPDFENGKKNVTWIAAASEYRLSLNTLKSDFRFRLEATASDYEKSNFIFIFADQSINIGNILPSGFHTENTNYGQFAWSLDAASETIEDNLILIGRNLFHKNVSQV